MSAQSPKLDWKVFKFGDFVECVREQGQPTEEDSRNYIGLEHLDSGSLHVKRWGSDADLKGQKLRMKKGDLLFAKRNAYLRRIAIAPHDGFFSAHGMVLRPKGKDILPEFLPFFLQSDMFMERAIEISVGSLSPTINWKTLRVQEFPLPPLDEQKRIAEILWAADIASEANLSVAARLEELRKPLLNSLIEKYKQDAGNLVRFVDFLDGKRVPVRQSDRAKRQGPYPYYGASGIVDYIDDYIFDEPLILLSEDGYNLVNRNSPVAFIATGKYWVNNHAHVLRPKEGIRIKFLCEYLESISYEPFITGTYQRKINKSACESIPVPLLSESDQLEIERRLANLDLAIKNANRSALDSSAIAYAFMDKVYAVDAHV